MREDRIVKALTHAFSLGLALSLLASSAIAGGFTNDNLNACGATNCAARTIQGTYTSAGNNTSTNNTWVHQVFCVAGGCCRLDVTAQAADLEMGVVSPDPSFITGGVSNIWADDDSGIGLNPLIVIDPVPRTGRYTVVLSRFSGGTTGTVNFTLRYGRYPTGNNPNCLSPTLPGGIDFEIPAEDVEEIKQLEAEEGRSLGVWIEEGVEEEAE